MNILYEDAFLILKTMLNKQVDFMLIGGYAVNYYGYNRVTGDMDVWLKPHNDNKKLLLEALTVLGFDEEGLGKINTWDFTQPQSFHIGKQPDKTDFMTHISGVKYEIAKQNAIQVTIDGLKLFIIHLTNLIDNKNASGRLKDLADVEYLQKIITLKNKQ